MQRYQRVALAVITSLLLSMPAMAEPAPGWTVEGIWDRVQAHVQALFTVEQQEVEEGPAVEPAPVPWEPDTTSATTEDLPPPGGEVGGTTDPNG